MLGLMMVALMMGLMRVVMKAESMDVERLYSMADWMKLQLARPMVE